VRSENCSHGDLLVVVEFFPILLHEAPFPPPFFLFPSFFSPKKTNSAPLGCRQALFRRGIDKQVFSVDVFGDVARRLSRFFASVSFSVWPPPQGSADSSPPPPSLVWDSGVPEESISGKSGSVGTPSLVIEDALFFPFPFSGRGVRCAPPTIIQNAFEDQMFPPPLQRNREPFSCQVVVPGRSDEKCGRLPPSFSRDLRTSPRIVYPKSKIF